MPKRNAWDSKNDEIARLKAEIEWLRDREFNLKYVKPFVTDVGESIMLMLSFKPFNQWPDEAKTAFRHCETKTPVPAQVYKQLLPK